MPKKVKRKPKKKLSTRLRAEMKAVDVTKQVGDRLMSEEEFQARDAARGVDAAGDPIKKVDDPAQVAGA